MSTVKGNVSAMLGRKLVGFALMFLDVLQFLRIRLFSQYALLAKLGWFLGMVIASVPVGSGSLLASVQM